MTLTPSRIPESAVPQFWNDGIHATVVVIAMGLAVLSGKLHIIDHNTVGNILSGGLAYAAGRAGSVAHRIFQSRQQGVPQQGGSVDATG